AEILGSGRTITVPLTVQAVGISFASAGAFTLEFPGSYSVSGGTLSIPSQYTLTIQVDAGTAEIDSTIGGSGSLAKSNPGTLIVTGSNNYAGTTTVQGGTLEATTPGSLPGYASGQVTVDGSSTPATTGMLAVQSGNGTTG